MKIAKRTTLLAGGLAAVLLAGAIALSGCTGGVASPAAAQEREPSGITVTGAGKALVVPDTGYVTLGVETTGQTAKEAMDENSARMAQVIERVQALGVSEREIQTSGINLFPEYDYNRPEQTGTPPRILGYRASNSVTITISDLDNAPAILDGVVGVGANTISGLRFGVKDESKLREQALAEASKQAQEKAKVIADALGVRVTGIAAVTEEYAGGPIVFRADMAKAEAAAAPPVMAGEMSIEARVQVTFRIQ